MRGILAAPVNDIVNIVAIALLLSHDKSSQQRAEALL